MNTERITYGLIVFSALLLLGYVAAIITPNVDSQGSRAVFAETAQMPVDQPIFHDNIMEVTNYPLGKDFLEYIEQYDGRKTATIEVLQKVDLLKTGEYVYQFSFKNNGDEWCLVCWNLDEHFENLKCPRIMILRPGIATAYTIVSDKPPMVCKTSLIHIYHDAYREQRDVDPRWEWSNTERLPGPVPK